MKKLKEIHTVGKRKEAVARVFVFPQGNGKIIINNKPLEFWGTEILRWRIREPLILVRDAIDLSKYDIYVNVKGSGLVSQAEAIRLAIARALAKIGKSKVEKIFENYDKFLLIADPRRCEPHHSSGKGASSRGSRRHKQRSKR
ncbi:MAG: 30S ribosomal protein S9 [Candidatus Aenigmatarchaeota archaeon]